MKTAIFITGMLFLLSGCVHVLSDEALHAVDPTVEYEQVKADPEAWRGSTLVLGGRIIEVTNERAGTTLEILRYNLDRSGYPTSVDEAGGRFMARIGHFLDPEVYEAGRMVALAGTVEGSETRPIGGVDYVYPVFRVGELRLLREPYRSYYYPSYYYGYPYYWDPFYDPWYPWYRYPYWPHRHPFYGF
jgi:outer membrane lipoprotein